MKTGNFSGVSPWRARAVSMLLAATIFIFAVNMDDGFSAGAREASAFNDPRGEVSFVRQTNKAEPARQTEPASRAESAQRAKPANTLPETALPEVTPLGTVFGIKLFTDGVIVASLSEVSTEEGMQCPARDAGILPGDYLLSVNGVEIAGNGQLAHYIGGCGGEKLSFTVKRDEEIFEASLFPVFSEGSFKTGMWIRDSAAGIGTFTFYHPQTGRFAGLGHGICDMDTLEVMSLKSGEPAPITLCGIVKSTVKSPGLLRGYFATDEPMGSLTANNETGVYGVLSSDALDGLPSGDGTMKIMAREQVKTGKVQIIATVDERGPRRCDAEITRISYEGETKNLIIKITDEELLQLTGGIVQGMSGCPIIQDGMLAGAVTHVFTDDPKTGYGIFAETMWEHLTAGGASK